MSPSAPARAGGRRSSHDGRGDSFRQRLDQVHAGGKVGALLGEHRHQHLLVMHRDDADAVDEPPVVVA
jgi:hypothetical protein